MSQGFGSKICVVGLPIHCCWQCIKSASINGNSIFVNNQVTDTPTLQTTYESTTDSNGKPIENRSINLRDITENKTVYVNLEGIIQQTQANTETFAAYNFNNISVSNKNL